ncbi:hypothetical protein NV379_18005 [Paenibacillus sp. N1-5-1-14]|uniref:hypothetical protein n=1 Tax=Paenibacillus radicibacter TaxID=2972488 RepID=UPI00215951D6|nr:hypothetical protein [Paenibacillus radicibacter]MCR8644551.1 hypothetical protein [Paenibacillus radicibacter]
MPAWLTWIKVNWLSVVLISGVIIATIWILAHKSEYELEDETETVDPHEKEKAAD